MLVRDEIRQLIPTAWLTWPLPMNEFTEVRPLRRVSFLRRIVHIQTDSQDHSERLLSKEWLVKNR